MRTSHLLSLLAVIVASAACSGSTEPTKPSTAIPGDPSTNTMAVAKSALEREANPSVSETDQAALRDGNTAFALDLYRSVRANTAGNILLSPHSISSVLAMTYAGARGNTESQMAKAMHFTLGQAQLHAAMNRLDAKLDGRQVRLDIVNSLWGQQSTPFLAPFLDTLAVNYGAGVQLVDFADSPLAAGLINGWVSENTQNKIAKLVEPDSFDSNTTLVLVNAIHFKGAWQSPFDASKTASGTFTRASGAVSVPMMQQTNELGYAMGADWQAVELPYAGGELGFVAIAPSPDAADFEAGLTTTRLTEILTSLHRQRVNVSMPKFSFAHGTDLVPHLKSLGMTDAFTTGVANLSGIDGSPLTVVDQAVHRAVIEVTEAGTEASGASSVEVTTKSMTPQVSLDHPFLFLIRDIETGAIVFLGWVADPTAT